METETTSLPKPKAPSGLAGFTIIWIGQLVSVVATQMSQFALTLFIYQRTSSAMALGLSQVFYIVPFLIITPIAGAMVDRYSRKLMMMISDIGAGVATLSLLILDATGVLQIWQLYAAMVVIGLVNAFQWPSYSAAITTMVSKKQYGRANGMMSLVDAGPGVIAPLLAGTLIAFIKLAGILTIDVITYILAVVTLAIVFIPQPKATEEGSQSKGSIWKEAVFGFRYIFARPSLLGLLTIFLIGNLFSGIAGTLFAPIVLARTGNNSVMMGTVQSTAAIAAVVGGVVMSAWGGFKRRDQWDRLGLGNLLLLRDGPVRFRPRPGGLDPHHHDPDHLRADDQQLQPGHLAIQGGPGCPGPGLFRPPTDRLDGPAHIPLDRRQPGGLCPRAGYEIPDGPVSPAGAVVRYRPGSGHGHPHHDLRHRRRPGGFDRIHGPRHPQCGDPPAGS